MKKLIYCSIFLSVILLAFTQPKKNTNAQNGKKIYDQYCLACHQADGNGVPRMNPPLAKTKQVNGDKQKLISIILKGMNEVVEINGEEYSNPMASHAFLTDQQIADVLTYVRSNFGNKASAVTAAEVAAARKKK